MPGITFSSNESAALRTFFEDSYEDLAFRDHPLMGVCSKYEQYGDSVKVPMKYAYGAGRSGTFATAQTNISDVARIAFLVTPSHGYGIGRVPVDDIRLTSNKKGGVVSMLTDGLESAARMASDDLEMLLFSDGAGTLATISSSGGSFTLVLTNPNDAYKFEVNQVFVTKASAFAASLDTGSFTVTNVDPLSSTAHITVTANGGWTPTNGHVIGRQGTMAASTSFQTFVGLTGWIPPFGSRPSPAENFFGVDRSVASVLLAGHYADCRQLNVKQSILKIAYSIANVSGAKPDVAFVSNSNMEKLETLVDAQALNLQTKGDGITVYYESIKVRGPKGPISVIGSPFCPSDKIWVLDSSTWRLGAPGPIIQSSLLNGEFFDMPTASSVEFRQEALGFFYTVAPGYNGVALVTP